FHERPQLVDATAVRGDGDRAPARVLDRGRGRRARVGLPTRDHHGRAARGVRLGDGAADAAAATRDDGDPPVEVELLPDLLACAHRGNLGARTLPPERIT